MKSTTRLAVDLVAQPAFLLVLVALAFALMMPALAGPRQNRTPVLAATASSAQPTQKQNKVQAPRRHHQTMPFFSFTTGG